jgi:hypothetical protein
VNATGDLAEIRLFATLHARQCVVPERSGFSPTPAKVGGPKVGSNLQDGLHRCAPGTLPHRV